MTKVEVTETVDTPADAVWKKVRAFDNMHKYLPEMIATCAVTGSGVGATRVCGMQGGGDIHERLEALDEATRTLTYSISESPMPISDYRGTIVISEAGPGKALVSWSSLFNLEEGADEAEMKGMIEGVFRAGIHNFATVQA